MAVLVEYEINDRGYNEKESRRSPYKPLLGAKLHNTFGSPRSRISLIFLYKKLMMLRMNSESTNSNPMLIFFREITDRSLIYAFEKWTFM